MPVATPFERLNALGHALDLHLQSQRLIWAILLGMTLLLCMTASLIGITGFSPDSWSYFELARHFFTGDFYQFNTYRSYFSDHYSASFPLGYPALLAALHLIFGAQPMLAVYLNILAALLSLMLILHLGKVHKLPALGSLTLALSLLCYPYYLDEIFHGRAMPAAIMMMLIAYAAQCSQRPWLAGICFGAAALMRFDFLVFAILAITAIFLLRRQSLRSQAQLWLGFVIGILPWVLYSYTHFGKLWISDNAWVATSVLPAFVLDYPAAAAVSIFQEPLPWLSKVLHHVLPLAQTMIEASLRDPLLIMASLWLVRHLTHIPHRQLGHGAIALLLILTALAPYLATGYFDFRYFSLVFLCFTGLFLVHSLSLMHASVAGLHSHGMLLIALAATLITGGSYLTEDVRQGLHNGPKMQQEADAIARINSCHRLHPERVYIFSNAREYGDFTAKYGALSGMKTAFIPSNFNAMNGQQKAAYFASMQPFTIIDDPWEVQACRQ